jgi:hypothetical protein
VFGLIYWIIPLVGLICRGNKWPKSFLIAILKQEGDKSPGNLVNYFTRISNNSRSNMTMVDDFGHLFLPLIVQL